MRHLIKFIISFSQNFYLIIQNKTIFFFQIMIAIINSIIYPYFNLNLFHPFMKMKIVKNIIAPNFIIKRKNFFAIRNALIVINLMINKFN